MSPVSTVSSLKSTHVNPFNMVHYWESLDSYCKWPISLNLQQEVAEQEEKRRFENEYERTRKEALERMKQAEEKKNEEERKRAEELRKQMEELKLREEEVFQTLDKVFLLWKMILQLCFKAFFSLSGNSSKEGARGSAGQAMGAGEDRGGKERDGEKAKEVWDGVREALSHWLQVRWYFILVRHWVNMICVPPGISWSVNIVLSWRGELSKCRRNWLVYFTLFWYSLHVIQLAWL